MIVYQIKIDDASFFFKRLKNIFTGKFIVVSEEKMREFWVEKKKHGLEMGCFMLLSQY